jgi:hypothetical protein
MSAAPVLLPEPIRRFRYNPTTKRFHMTYITEEEQSRSMLAARSMLATRLSCGPNDVIHVWTPPRANENPDIIDLTKEDTDDIIIDLTGDNIIEEDLTEEEMMFHPEQVHRVDEVEEDDIEEEDLTDADFAQVEEQVQVQPPVQVQHQVQHQVQPQVQEAPVVTQQWRRSQRVRRILQRFINDPIFTQGRHTYRCPNVQYRTNRHFSAKKLEVMTEKECYVCQMPIKLANLYVTSCNHVYCSMCFESWNRNCYLHARYREVSCPFCRRTDFSIDCYLPKKGK